MKSNTPARPVRIAAHPRSSGLEIAEQWQPQPMQLLQRCCRPLTSLPQHAPRQTPPGIPFRPHLNLHLILTPAPQPQHLEPTQPPPASVPGAQPGAGQRSGRAVRVAETQSHQSGHLGAAQAACESRLQPARRLEGPPLPGCACQRWCCARHGAQKLWLPAPP